jgi:hypothetical protein
MSDQQYKLLLIDFLTKYNKPLTIKQVEDIKKIINIDKKIIKNPSSPGSPRQSQTPVSGISNNHLQGPPKPLHEFTESTVPTDLYVRNGLATKINPKYTGGKSKSKSKPKPKPKQLTTKSYKK